MTNNRLPRSTPEAQGISSSALSALITAVEQQNIELHSMMLVRHGHIIAEGWWSTIQRQSNPFALLTQ